MGNEADAAYAERVAVVTGAAGAMGYEISRRRCQVGGPVA